MANNENTRAPAGGSDLASLERLPENPTGRDLAALASAPASAPLPLTDDRIVDCAASAGLHDEMWFGPDTPKGYEDCMPKLRAFARLIARERLAAAPAADEREKLRAALQEATDALAGGLWDYGPGQDEHAKCNEVIQRCRAALSGGSPEPDGESQP